jgi:hypothetical protein
MDLEHVDLTPITDLFADVTGAHRTAHRTVAGWYGGSRGLDGRSCHAHDRAVVTLTDTHIFADIASASDCGWIDRAWPEHARYL